MLRGQRAFSSKVVHYTGSNVNITPHNKDLRQGIDQGTSNVVTSFNMGYEGFSTPWSVPRSNPIIGNRGEFLFLALLLPAVLLAKKSRRKNEDGLRKAIGNSTNRYAVFAKVNPTEL